MTRKRPNPEQAARAERPRPHSPGRARGGGEHRPQGRDGDVTGVFRRAAGGYGFVRPEGALPGDRSGDIHIAAAASLDAASGDTVRVNVKVKEGDKERTQAFEGVVIAIKRGGNRTTFTVRKNSYGVGVERIFPLFAPTVESVDVLSSSRVRRAKLTYLRKRVGKGATAVKEKEARMVPGAAAPAAAK